jgi:hypothetical protein
MSLPGELEQKHVFMLQIYVAHANIRLLLALMRKIESKGIISWH